MADMTVTIEDAQIVFRNFKGEVKQFNADGKRQFAVILDPELAVQMLEDGWNVKELRAREEGDEPTPYVQVEASYKFRPPRVMMLTSTSRTALDEDSIGMLDYADILKTDLIIRGYEWSVNGKSGVKAYLQSLFVTIQEDELERKYGVFEDDHGYAEEEG